MTGRPLFSVSSRYSVLEIGLEGVGEAIDQSRARADVHAAPRSAFECGARALHRAVDILGGRIRNPRDHVAGGGIADVEHLAGAGLDLAAVDKIAVDFDFDGGCLAGIFIVSSFDDHGVALQRRQHAFFGLRDMRLDDAGGGSPVAPLHRLDQGDVLGHQLRRIVALHVGDADAHQAVGLSDQVAQRRRHSAIAGGMGQRRVEGAVVGDEVFMVSGKQAEFIQRLQDVVAGALDRFGNAGRLQREAEPQQVARIRQRDRVDPVALARQHRDQMLALQPQQRLAHRLAAHGITLGQLLLSHIITWSQAAG